MSISTKSLDVFLYANLRVCSVFAPIKFLPFSILYSENQYYVQTI